MEWNRVRGMERNEIFGSKLMLDAPKGQSRSLQDQSQRLAGTLKFAFGSTSSSKLGYDGPSGQPLGHSEGPSWRSWASSWSPPGIILVPREAVLDGPGFHFEGPKAPHGYIFLTWQQFY